MWKKISSKKIFEHPRLTLIEDEVELPGGKRIQYLRYGDTGGSAAMIIALKDDKILVEREYSYPPNKVLYQFPGGGVPAGEPVAEGANRELMEECGYKGELTEIGKFLSNNRRSNKYMHVFVAQNLIEAKLPEDDEEEIELLWLAETEIDVLIAKGEIENGPMLAAWPFFKACRDKA